MSQRTVRVLIALVAGVAASLLMLAITYFDLSLWWFFPIGIGASVGLIAEMRRAAKEKDEFQWAAFRWARAWSLVAGIIILVGLQTFMIVAPAVAAPLRNCLLGLVGTNDPFVAGMQISTYALVICLGIAHVIWWLRHR